MAKLLFKLNQVPLDEAIEVRQLLQGAEIEFYETDAGRFGFGVAALWLRDESQWGRAKTLLDNYQQERATKAGPAEPWPQFFRRQPLKVLGLLLLLGAVLYLLLAPFLGMLLPN
ncbi:MAG: DUF6164 family protein [Cellvibrionaceae bacterium]|nr:DUF6164 family protein [Cellvibrionaceae bacterium]MCV6625838.1 DUF6164 family protein [Cellvibrionaceae bacterium]